MTRTRTDEQQELWLAYTELAAAIAAHNIPFRKEIFSEPDTPRPSLRRIHIPQRKPSHYSQYSARQKLFRWFTGEAKLKVALTQTQSSDDVDTPLDISDLSLHDRLQLQQSYLERMLTSSNNVSIGNTIARSSYELRMDAQLRPFVQRFAAALPPVIRNHAADLFVDVSLPEHLADVYMSVLSQNRLVVSEYKRQASHFTFDGEKVLLPLHHMLEVLGLPDTWWSAKYLHIQYRKYEDDNTFKLNPLDALGSYVRRFLLGNNKSLFAITDNHAVEYTLHRYLYHHHPKLLGNVCEMGNRYAKYAAIDVTAIQKQMSVSADRLGVHHARVQAALRTDVPFTRIINRSTLEDLVGAIPRQQEDLVNYCIEMFNDMAHLAKQQQLLIINPLTGGTANELLTDLDPGVPHVAHGKHAYMVRDVKGRYPALSAELNERAGVIYRLTHYILIAGSSALHTVGRSGSQMVDNLTHRVPLSAETQERISAVLKEGLGKLPDQAFDRLQEGIYERHESVVDRNPFGALLRDNMWELIGLTSPYIVRNLADGARKGKVSIAVRKIIHALTHLGFYNLLVDALDYDPSLAYTKLFGHVDVDHLSGERKAMNYVARSLVGNPLPLDPMTKFIGGNEMAARDVMADLGAELLRHPDNIYNIYAAGVLCRHLGMHESALEHLLTVEGWIEKSHNDRFELLSERERNALKVDLISGAKYHMGMLDQGFQSKLIQGYIAYRYRTVNRRELIPMTIDQTQLVTVTEPSYQPYPEQNDPLALMSRLLVTPFDFSLRSQLVRKLDAAGSKNQMMALLENTYRQGTYLAADLLQEDIRDLIDLDSKYQYTGARLSREFYSRLQQNRNYRPQQAEPRQLSGSVPGQVISLPPAPSKRLIVRALPAGETGITLYGSEGGKP